MMSEMKGISSLSNKKRVEKGSSLDVLTDQSDEVVSLTLLRQCPSPDSKQVNRIT